jgi:hypothetical protein
MMKIRQGEPPGHDSGRQTTGPPRQSATTMRIGAVKSEKPLQVVFSPGTAGHNHPMGTNQLNMPAFPPQTRGLI